MEPSNTLIYFVKYPEPGKVKTRLARTIGFERAAEIYRQLVESNLHVLTEVKEPFRLIVAFDPAEKECEIRNWLKPFEVKDYIPQKGNDLGERLEQAFTYAFQGGQSGQVSARVMVLGSDTLELTSKIILDGFAALESHDAVLGPARDGGYYLLGLSVFDLGVFESIAWSTGQVTLQTLQYWKNQQRTYFQLPELEDLDEAEQLKLFESR